MVKIAAHESAAKIVIVGHGITVPERYELAPGVVVEPEVPSFEVEAIASGSDRFYDYVAVLTGKDLSSFCLEIEEKEGGKALVRKAWNALWTFHLLSLASLAPCISLFSVGYGEAVSFSPANRNLVIKPVAGPVATTVAQLSWARQHYASFNSLISHPEFSSAMRCYGNAHYLFDLDMRIMLLWSGIEGLLVVDGELNRRLALYAAMLLEGTADEKVSYFKEVKRVYGLRSRAVHGSKLNGTKLREGYIASSRILARLLARCVELGRVPSVDELDALAVSQSVR